MAEKMPSSVKLGSRPIRSRMRWYSSGFSPCALMSSGVMATVVWAVMGCSRLLTTERARRAALAQTRAGSYRTAKKNAAFVTVIYSSAVAVVAGIGIVDQPPQDREARADVVAALRRREADANAVVEMLGPPGLVLVLVVDQHALARGGLLEVPGQPGIWQFHPEEGCALVRFEIESVEGLPSNRFARLDLRPRRLADRVGGARQHHARRQFRQHEGQAAGDHLVGDLDARSEIGRTGDPSGAHARRD